MLKSVNMLEHYHKILGCFSCSRIYLNGMIPCKWKFGCLIFCTVQTLKYSKFLESCYKLRSVNCYTKSICVALVEWSIKGLEINLSPKFPSLQYW